MKFYKKGDVLTYEGNEAKEIFILESGKLGIFKKDKLITEIDTKGSIVGELAMILQNTRSASVIALEDSAVYEIKVPLEVLAEKYPDVTVDILKSLAKRLVKTTNQLALK